MKNISDDLLVKYLLLEVDAAERRQVEEWMGENEENKRYFDHFRLIWDKSRDLAAASTVDENAAWERFKQRTQPEGHTGHDIPKALGRVIDLPRRFNYIRAAALLLVLIGAGWMVWFMTGRLGSGQMIALRTEDNTLTQTLPDGSVITLNKRSSISYPEHFTGGERIVSLKGEAFFDVAHDKTHPFIIHADDVRVKVVGTSFNVKTTADKTEVIVATGVVEVAKDRFAVKLNPNEKATVSKNNAQPVKETNTDELYNFYRTHELICNGTPLWRLVDVLNEAYGVHIVIADNNLRDQPLTTSFHNESLDNILRVLSETFNITVERKNGQIILK